MAEETPTPRPRRTRASSADASSTDASAQSKPAAGTPKPAAKRATPKPAAKKATAKKPATKRKTRDPEAEARAWARQLAKKRPGLIPFVLDNLAAEYGRPEWQPRLEPASELILTILSANSADINAEVAFDALRDRWPSASTPDGVARQPRVMPGWGGIGVAELPPPDWAAVEAADLDELTNVIRPGGLANQKAPRVQAALRALAGNGGYSLEFLKDLPALEARDWLAAIPGIGKKTASVVLLFSYGMPLMPVDRHVFRVSQRLGLLPPKCDPDTAHDYFLAMLESDQMYAMHVSLITHGRRTCHAQRPECARCPLASRCRFVEPKAP